MDSSRFVFRPYIQHLKELKELYLEAEEIPYKDNGVNIESDTPSQIINPSNQQVVNSDTARISPDNVYVQKVSQLKDEDARNRFIYKQAQKTVTRELETQSPPKKAKTSSSSNSDDSKVTKETKNNKHTEDPSSDSEDKKQLTPPKPKKKRQKRSYKDLFEF